MGSVLSIWHEYREAGLDDPENAKLPPMADLQAAAQHMNIDDLILDEAAQTVYFADPEMKLDVGAVAKGYATEIVSQMLLAGDMPSFIISAAATCAWQSPRGRAHQVGRRDSRPGRRGARPERHCGNAVRDRLARSSPRAIISATTWWTVSAITT